MTRDSPTYAMDPQLSHFPRLQYQRTTAEGDVAWGPGQMAWIGGEVAKRGFTLENEDSVVQWPQLFLFFPFFWWLPHHNGLPQKGFLLFFPRVTEQLRKEYYTITEKKGPGESLVNSDPDR